MSARGWIEYRGCLPGIINWVFGPCEGVPFVGLKNCHFIEAVLITTSQLGIGLSTGFWGLATGSARGGGRYGNQVPGTGWIQ